MFPFLLKVRAPEIICLALNATSKLERWVKVMVSLLLGIPDDFEDNLVIYIAE